MRERIEYLYRQEISDLIKTQQETQQKLDDTLHQLEGCKIHIEQLENNKIKYANKGDYCAVCGCREFHNDEEE